MPTAGQTRDAARPTSRHSLRGESGCIFAPCSLSIRPNAKLQPSPCGRGSITSSELSTPPGSVTCAAASAAVQRSLATLSCYVSIDGSSVAGDSSSVRLIAKGRVSAKSCGRVSLQRACSSSLGVTFGKRITLKIGGWSRLKIICKSPAGDPHSARTAHHRLAVVRSRVGRDWARAGPVQPPRRRAR